MAVFPLRVSTAASLSSVAVPVLQSLLDCFLLARMDCFWATEGVFTREFLSLGVFKYHTRRHAVSDMAVLVLCLWAARALSDQICRLAVALSPIHHGYFCLFTEVITPFYLF